MVYTVGAQSGSIGGPGSPLAGNAIEMEKSYVAALDNLDASYYTYSLYGVDSDRNRVLEAVAIGV